MLRRAPGFTLFPYTTLFRSFVLLGRPPFSGKTPEQILAKQTTDDVPPLSAERRDVPRELEDVLRRALRSDPAEDRKSTRLNSSHLGISYAVFCLKKKKKTSN